MVDIASMRIIFESKGWQDLMDKQEKIEKKAEETGKATEKSSHIQVEGLKAIRKHWKLLTGAIVGAFYSIAKLSPLFASYLSEFGGILGYIYDTALIPWGDEIEWILDKGWAFGEWLDQQPPLVQKFVGMLLIGIPVIFGFAIALSVLNSALIGLGVSGGLSGILTALGGLATSAVAVTVFGVAMGVVIGLLGVFILYKTGVLKWVYDVGAAFGAWLVDLGARFGAWVVDKGAKFGTWLVDIRAKFKIMVYDTKIWLGELFDKIGKVFDRILELGKIIPGGESVNWGVVLGNEPTGSSQTGSTITQTGLYKLHQGEEVISSTLAGGSGGSEVNMIFSPVINVGGGFSNSYDARKLADDLRRFWMDDVRAVVGGSHR